MPIDAYNLQRTKEMILSFVRARGPSLPVHIAKEVKTSPLFAGAFLSELYNEQKLRMSHMKVGSTALYLLPGQEAQLENFIQYLNKKEQEAVHLLKQNTTLEDDKIPPAIRVALREIKDFAIPTQQMINGQQKLVWKYAYAQEQKHQEVQHSSPHIPASIQQAVQSQIAREETPQIQVQTQAENVQEKIQVEKPEEEKEEKTEEFVEKPKRKYTPKPVQPQIQPSFSITTVDETPKTQELEETPFGKSVKHHLKEKGIEIKSIELEKKKDFIAILRVKTSFGHQDYYCIAKDKKKIQEADIPPALQKAQEKRMPVLFVIPGLPDKKAQALLEHWGNLIKFDKI